MTMFFGNFFSSTGSSNPFGAIKKIDYKTLDHPGPELAAFAEQGLAPSESLRDPNLKLATFAGGCFWGLELAYQRVPGVAYTAVGYTHGNMEAPNYELVCSGSTGHTEAVMVYYDPKECSYNQLIDVFFNRVDPTQVNRQGNDRGTQYRTGVYFHTPEQEQLAKAKFEEVAKNYRQPIATELKAAKPFWPAERYHQQYLEKGGQNAEKGATERIRCYG
jgi:peptide-methionine (S)-S-oxide reductase